MKKKNKNVKETKLSFSVLFTNGKIYHILRMAWVKDTLLKIDGSFKEQKSCTLCGLHYFMYFFFHVFTLIYIYFYILYIILYFL